MSLTEACAMYLYTELCRQPPFSQDLGLWKHPLENKNAPTLPAKPSSMCLYFPLLMAGYQQARRALRLS